MTRTIKPILVVGGKDAFHAWQKENPELRDRGVHIRNEQDCAGYEASGVVLLHDSYKFPVRTEVLQSRVR